MLFNTSSVPIDRNVTIFQQPWQAIYYGISRLFPKKYGLIEFLVMFSN